MIAAFVGSFEGKQEQALRAATARADHDPVFFPDVTSAQRGLGSTQATAPSCFFVDGAVPVESLVSWLRGEGRLFSIPVVVLAHRAVDQVFGDAHALGADDVLVAGDPGGVTRRLANLNGFDPAVRPPVTQGGAVVAHSDERRRRILGRVLRQAGYEVSFAASGEELEQIASNGDPPRLLVAVQSLPSKGAREAIAAVRASTGKRDLTAVVLVPGPNPDAEQRDGNDLEAVAFASEQAPADNLVFLANELLRPDVKNVRASERFLHGTLCAFRRAGGFDPVYGLTYNLSREGLYVRTLDPPPAGTNLWFEMRPPGRTAAVHLRGRVVWCRGMTSPGGAAPPGFGLRIDPRACPPDDLEDYQLAYGKLRDQATA